MRRSAIGRVGFILYCIEAGVFLLMVPWSQIWEQVVYLLPAAWLRAVALEPVVRGAISGFGLVHLVWGAHDLEAWLAERAEREQRAA